jgi:hypothetical protein
MDREKETKKKQAKTMLAAEHAKEGSNGHTYPGGV